MAVVAALPPILLIVIAGAALLSAYAFGQLIAQPLARALANLPVIGQDIANALIGAAQGVERWAQDFFDNSVTAINDLIDAASGYVQYWIEQATDLLEYAAERVNVLLGVAASLQQQLQDRVGDLRDAIAAVVKDAAKALDRAIAVAADLARTVAKVVPDLIAKAVATVRDWVVGRLEDLRRAILATVAAVETALLGKVSVEQAARVAADGRIRDDTQDWLDELARQLGSDVATLGRQIGTAIDGLDLDIGDLWKAIGVVGSIPLATLLTQVITQVTTLERECIRPGCDYLGPQIDVLNAVQSAATLGTLLAWMEHATHHPEAAAAETVAGLDAILGPVRDLAGGLFGGAV